MDLRRIDVNSLECFLLNEIQRARVCTDSKLIVSARAIKRCSNRFPHIDAEDIMKSRIDLIVAVVVGNDYFSHCLLQCLFCNGRLTEVEILISFQTVHRQCSSRPIEKSNTFLPRVDGQALVSNVRYLYHNEDQASI